METNIGDLINRLIDFNKDIDRVEKNYEKEWEKQQVDRFYVELYLDWIETYKRGKQDLIKEINELWEQIKKVVKEFHLEVLAYLEAKKDEAKLSELK